MENPDANRKDAASDVAGSESFSVSLTESDSRESEEYSTAKKTYPLRGRRYRYELPHEAVALNEWGVVG